MSAILYMYEYMLRESGVMSVFSKLIPDAEFHGVCDISPELLREMGIRAVALDNDNTLAKYSESAPSPEVKAWMDGLRNAGIGAVLVSNTHHPARLERIADELGISWRDRCAKPSAKGFLWAAETLGVRPHEMLSIGDQIFTDVLGAHRAGAKAAIVYPRGMDENFLFRVRRFFELPFIAACGRRERKRRKNG